MNGPASIMQGFSRTIKEWGFQKPTPAEITQPFHVTKIILEAINGEPDTDKKKRQRELIDEPIGQKRRQNTTRGARYGGTYVS